MPFITQGKANLKYILIVVVLAAIVGGGILGYLYIMKKEGKMPEIPGVIKYSECEAQYTIHCSKFIEEEKKVITTKENMPCSNDNDCSYEKMKSNCNPDSPSLLLCIGAKYYCGSDGYCKGCDCPPSKETANWEIYRNEELKYEFRYPPNWIEPSRAEGDNTFSIGYALKDGSGTYSITVGFLGNLLFGSYCGEHSEDTSRCESGKIGGSSSMIDWEWDKSVPYTKIDEEGKLVKNTQTKTMAFIFHYPTYGLVTFELQPVVPESKETLKQILSTFRFLPQ